MESTKQPVALQGRLGEAKERLAGGMQQLAQAAESLRSEQETSKAAFRAFYSSQVQLHQLQQTSHAQESRQANLLTQVRSTRR